MNSLVLLISPYAQTNRILPACQLHRLLEGIYNESNLATIRSVITVAQCRPPVDRTSTPDVELRAGGRVNRHRIMEQIPAALPQMGVGAWLLILVHHIVMSRSGVATCEVSET